MASAALLLGSGRLFNTECARLWSGSYGRRRGTRDSGGGCRCCRRSPCSRSRPREADRRTWERKDHGRAVLGALAVVGLMVLLGSVAANTEAPASSGGPSDSCSDLMMY